MQARLDQGRLPGSQERLVLNSDLSLTRESADPSKYETGLRFAFGRFVAAPVNPATSELAMNRVDKAGASRQASTLLNNGYSASLALMKNNPELRRMMERKAVQDAVLTAEGAVDAASELAIIRTWQAADPAKEGTLPQLHNEATRKAMSLSLEYDKAMMQPLKQSLWNNVSKVGEATEAEQYATARAQLGTLLGLEGKDLYIIDGWVRQYQVATDLSEKALEKLTPEQRKDYEDGKNPLGEPRFEEAMAALDAMQENVTHHRLPTSGFLVAGLRLNDLLKVYEGAQKANSLTLDTKRYREYEKKANQLRDKAERETLALNTEGMTLDRTDWLYINFAEMMLGEVTPAAIPYQDALMTSMRQEEGLLVNDLVITDAEKASLLSLLSDDANLAMDALTARRLLDPEQFNVWQDHQKQIFGAIPTETGWDLPSLSESVQGKTRKRLNKYLQQADVPEMYTLAKDDLSQFGRGVAKRQNSMHTLLRIAFNIRAFNALLDPRLAVGAAFDSVTQMTLDSMTAAVTGTATKGRFSLLDEETQNLVRHVEHVLTGSSTFDQMVGEEFRFDQENRNVVERTTGKMAQFAGRLQDIYWGVGKRKYASMYVRAVMEGIQFYNSTGVVKLSPKQILQELQADPLYLAKNGPEQLHQNGLNAIANTKKIRTTTLSRAFRGVMDPMLNSPNGFVQFPASFLVGLPSMFATYGFNATMNVLGLNGLDHVVSVFMTGSERGAVNKFLMKSLYKMSGQDPADVSEEYDLRDTLQYMDAGVAMIRGQVSLTSILAVAAVFAALGMGGEDDEDRKRRARARYQGVAYLYDPLDIANDFRNGDVIFLENLPFGLGSIFQVTGDDENGEGARSMAQMNFITKALLSPSLGIARFMSSGNPSDIVAGFEDALMALPLVNTMMWGESLETFDALIQEADRHQASGTNGSELVAWSYVLKAVSVLERYMFENAFVNEVYQSLDRYDRDNWAVPAQENGTLNRDWQGETERSRMLTPNQGDSETETFNEDGSVNYSYVTATDEQAAINALGEKRFGVGLVSLLASKVVPGMTSAWRYDQAVKQRTYTKNEFTAEEGYALVLALQTSGVTPELQEELNTKFMSGETRAEVQAMIQSTVETNGQKAGLNSYQINKNVSIALYGDPNNAYSVGALDILWGNYQWKDVINSEGTVRYNQLNTNYVEGPDGQFYATGVARNSIGNFVVANTLGLSRFLEARDTGLGNDEVLNTIDRIAGINTGRRGLEKVVTDSEETLAAAEEAAKEAAKKSKDDDKDDEKSKDKDNDGNSGGRGGYGYRRRGYSRRGYSRRGGGGGGGGGYATKLNAPDPVRNPYGSDVRGAYLDTISPRRSTIRRERTDSEKGRLKPWQ